MGGAGESRMTSHQQKKLDVEALHALPRSLRPAALRRPGRARCASIARPRTAARCATCASAAHALGGYTAARAAARAAARRAAARALRATSRSRADGKEMSTTMALRAPARQPAQGPRRSGRASCRSSPTRRARSAWRTCSARSASIRRVGQLLRARGRRLDARATARPRDGQLLEEGITEAGALVVVDGRGHRVQRARPADAAVLHLLLDVRLPARRRPDLGRRRPARARLPARRDGGPHHARRRRPAAPGRQRATCIAATVPNCRAYDPAFACELAVIVDHGMRQMLERQATTCSTTSP